jgi:hypothetical protein
MGFPVAATITAATSIASSVLPSVLGGKSAFEKKQEAVRRRRKLKRIWENAKAALDELEARLSAQMTEAEARKVLQNRAENKRVLWESRWGAKLAGLPRDLELAEAIGRKAQQIYIDAANWVALKSDGPKYAGGLAALLGAGGLAYSVYQNQ